MGKNLQLNQTNISNQSTCEAKISFSCGCVVSIGMLAFQRGACVCLLLLLLVLFFDSSTNTHIYTLVTHQWACANCATERWSSVAMLISRGISVSGFSRCRTNKLSLNPGLVRLRRIVAHACVCGYIHQTETVGQYWGMKNQQCYFKWGGGQGRVCRGRGGYAQTSHGG